MLKSKILSKYQNLIHYFGDKNSTLDDKNIILAEQIHENKVAIINNNNTNLIKSADGLVTNQRLTLGIRTADCLPIFFYDSRNKIIAAVHAGWKGLSLRIIESVIKAMKRMGANYHDLIVTIGPHIQDCCYDVSIDRVKKFLKLTGSKDIAVFRNNSWYLNLSEVALCQLKLTGINYKNIEVSDVCTSCDFRFWSFRRDKEKAGRMINVIGFVKH